jgi:hypothetical protein
MLSAEFGAFLVRVKGVGIVDRSLRRPSLAGRWALWSIGDRVGQGKHPASVHRLKYGDRLAFRYPLADQRRPLGADVAQLRAALAEDGDCVIVERVARLEAQLNRYARRAQHALHAPVALARVLVRKVDAINKGRSQ